MDIQGSSFRLSIYVAIKHHAQNSIRRIQSNLTSSYLYIRKLIRELWEDPTVLHRIGSRNVLWLAQITLSVPFKIAKDSRSTNLKLKTLEGYARQLVLVLQLGVMLWLLVATWGTTCVSNFKWVTQKDGLVTTDAAISLVAVCIAVVTAACKLALWAHQDELVALLNGLWKFSREFAGTYLETDDLFKAYRRDKLVIMWSVIIFLTSLWPAALILIVPFGLAPWMALYERVEFKWWLRVMAYAVDFIVGTSILGSFNAAVTIVAETLIACKLMVKALRSYSPEWRRGLRHHMELTILVDSLARLLGNALPVVLICMHLLAAMAVAVLVKSPAFIYPCHICLYATLLMVSYSCATVLCVFLRQAEMLLVESESLLLEMRNSAAVAALSGQAVRGVPAQRFLQIRWSLRRRPLAIFFGRFYVISEGAAVAVLQQILDNIINFIFMIDSTTPTLLTV